MKKKTMLAVLSSASVIAGVTTSVIPTATAATYYTPYKTHIVMNGKDFSDPYHIVAKEYSTAEPTSWLPIWYLFNVLNQLGVQSTWDGQHWNLQLPDGLNADLTNPVTSHNSGDIAIQLNGTTVQYAPRIAYKDPGGTDTTSYIPIWYVQQVAKRLGVTYSWDGTTWGMTSSFTPPQLNKLALVKDFVTALNIPANSSGTNPYDDVSTADWPYVNAISQFFQADSATHFGATDASTVDMLDHAYQLFLGIPDSHMSWNAGGNLTAWANTIKLNSGLAQGSSLSTANEQQVVKNITGLNKGYTVDSDGTYHIVFKPYDAYTQWSSNAFVNQAFITSGLATDISRVDSITFKMSDNVITFTVPGLSNSSSERLTVGSLFNHNGNSTQYSLDGGGTWKQTTGFYGYDSRDSNNGGVSNPPNTVLVKTTDHVEVSDGELTSQYDAGLVTVGITPGSEPVVTSSN